MSDWFDEDLEKIKKKGNFCGTFELLAEFKKLADKIKEDQQEEKEQKPTN